MSYLQQSATMNIPIVFRFHPSLSHASGCEPDTRDDPPLIFCARHDITSMQQFGRPLLVI